MQGRKPLRAEWRIFEHAGLDSREWLVQKATPTQLQIINKATGEIKNISVDITEV